MAFMSSKESLVERSNRNHKEHMAEFGSARYRGESEPTATSTTTKVEYAVAVEIPGLIDDLKLEISSLREEVEMLSKKYNDLNQQFIQWQSLSSLQNNLPFNV